MYVEKCNAMRPSKLIARESLLVLFVMYYWVKDVRMGSINFLRISYEVEFKLHIRLFIVILY